MVRADRVWDRRFARTGSGKERVGEEARRVLALVAAALVLLALLTVFAIELSNTQAKSKRDVEARVHERGGARGGADRQPVPDRRAADPAGRSRLYGAATSSAQTMRPRTRSGERATSRCSTPRTGTCSRARAASRRRRGPICRTRRRWRWSARGTRTGSATAPVRQDRRARISRSRSRLRSATRILLTGFAPDALGVFLAGELRQIPGVKGAHNYVIDGNRRGARVDQPGAPGRLPLLTRRQQVDGAQPHVSGDRNGHYYDQVPLANSTWRIVLSAPERAAVRERHAGCASGSRG